MANLQVEWCGAARDYAIFGTILILFSDSFFLKESFPDIFFSNKFLLSVPQLNGRK